MKPLALFTLTLFVAVRPALAQEAAPAVDAAPSTQTLDDSHSNWKRALADSFKLLMLEHATRIGFQDKTRGALGGPFFRDYRRSIRMPTTWEDGDAWSVNYVGHPIHGAAAGFIFLDHESDGAYQKLGWSRGYWASRGKAAAWAAGYSFQFEFGPLSEASLGNVGMDPRTTGWVDHVVTPAGAFAFIVAEDALDHYLIVRIEHWTSNRVLIAAARMVFNPSRSMANATEGHVPWFRATRPLR